MNERTIKKSLFTETLQDRLQLFLLLRNAQNNINLHKLFQKN